MCIWQPLYQNTVPSTIPEIHVTRFHFTTFIIEDLYVPVISLLWQRVLVCFSLSTHIYFFKTAKLCLDNHCQIGHSGIVEGISCTHILLSMFLQCAAVTTQYLLIKDPPQKNTRFLFLRYPILAIHGNCPREALLPLIILVGLPLNLEVPQSVGSPSLTELLLEF